MCRALPSDRRLGTLVEVLRWESLALRAAPLPQDDTWIVGQIARVGRLESDWLRGSLRGLNLLLRLTQGLRPGLHYFGPSGLGLVLSPFASLECRGGR